MKSISNISTGGNGSGHTIENAAGTDLTQRNTLQFAGALKTTDDSLSEKTIVTDDADIYTWEQWNQLTPQQQTAIPKAIITGTPDIDGGVTADLMTKLWENESPSSAFAAQDITLSSGDYDFLLWIYALTINSTVTDIHSEVVSTGTGTVLSFTQAVSGTVTTYTRRLNYVTTTSYNIEDGYVLTNKNNNAIIPIAIYGIKKTINLEFSAIASNVSTSADKCMLEDGITSVQDSITTITQNMQGLLSIQYNDAQNVTIKSGNTDLTATPPTVAGYTCLCLIGAYISTSSKMWVKGIYYENGWKLRTYSDETSDQSRTLKYTWIYVKNI